MWRRATRPSASPRYDSRLRTQYVGGGSPDDYGAHGMVLHLLYGTVAGGVFAAAPVVDVLGEVTLTTAVGGGIGYGLVLMAVGAGFWVRGVLAMEGAPRR